MQDSTDYSNLNDWQKLADVVVQFPQFNISQINWLLRNKETNGLNRIIKKIGKFNYAHVPSFSRWISTQ